MLMRLAFIKSQGVCLVAKKVKSVSFNDNDPFEDKLLKHSNQFPNFSGYVKRLIQRDMEGWSPIQQPIIKEQSPADIDKGLMEGLI
jgi:hypothetical protein